MKNIEQFKIGIVVSKFNDFITSRLANGAKQALLQQGIPAANITTLDVPGSFELPLAAQLLLSNAKVHGVVALGCIINGDTDHYQYVCSSTTSGLMQVQLNHSAPITFGVLTCKTMEQAIDRAGGKSGNKGKEAAETLLEMLALKSQLMEIK